MNIDIIDKNLKECWKFYKEYLESFRKNNYSDVKPMDFIEYCENELYQCPNCYEIYRKDDLEKLDSDYNSDKVCDWCIEESGYYD